MVTDMYSGLDTVTARKHSYLLINEQQSMY